MKNLLSYLSVLLLGCTVFLYPVKIQAQEEIEPNNACAAAQDLGEIALPTTVMGSLDSTPEVSDIDFFRVAAVPGELIQVDLEGASTGVGTLPDPLLGLFDSACAQFAVNDDSGSGVNSRLSFEVPADGVFILGATTCCDFGFVGGGQGSYLLTLSRSQTIGSIGGRLVNDNTGAPLPGTDVPFAFAQLVRCNADGCFEYIGFQQADDAGLFLFDRDQYNNPLSLGTYQIQASAHGFEFFVGEPFDVAEGETRDLGDLGLVPQRLIGSVSGRVVDAIDGSPLPGNGPPFVVLYLQRCEDFGCFIVAGTNPDEQGRFRFDGLLYFLSPGVYQMLGFAEDYRETTSMQFAVDAFEDVDFGDFLLTPFPIQFGAVHGCEIPPGGGLCEYGIEVRNRGLGRYKGEAWSTVDFQGPPSFRNTRFQVGHVGKTNPMPHRINLKQGQSQTLVFQLDVPGNVPEGSVVCATATVGRDPAPQFESQGDRFIFCSVKQSDGFAVLSEKEGRKRLREVMNKERGPKAGHIH